MVAKIKEELKVKQGEILRQQRAEEERKLAEFKKIAHEKEVAEIAHNKEKERIKEELRLKALREDATVQALRELKQEEAQRIERETSAVSGIGAAAAKAADLGKAIDRLTTTSSQSLVERADEEY